MSQPQGYCRGCGAAGLDSVLDLGEMPLSDNLLHSDDPTPAQRYPLRVALCRHCALLQLREAPPPLELFPADYPYYSSYSSDYLRHAGAHAAELIRRRQLDANSLVLEIGCNDGYLLRHFQAQGIPVLGVDPAPGPVAAARQLGIPVQQAFFDAERAAQLRAQGVLADLILGNNVLAHVPSPDVLVAAAASLLRAAGELIFEVPYVVDLLALNAVDTIYHEHHCYFSLTALEGLFSRQGLTLLDVQRIPVHGGSLRVSAGYGEAAPGVAELLAQEQRLNIRSPVAYQGLEKGAQRLAAELRALLEALRARGARVAAYGAAAKGTILLNLAGIDGRLCEYVVDRNPHKHGRRMPGVDLPVLGVEQLERDPPDYLIILAWNWATEIIEQQRAYSDAGGQFILPLPTLRVLPG